jgi:hypothetical protein
VALLSTCATRDVLGNFSGFGNLRIVFYSVFCQKRKARSRLENSRKSSATFTKALPLLLHEYVLSAPGYWVNFFTNACC